MRSYIGEAGRLSGLLLFAVTLSIAPALAQQTPVPAPPAATAAASADPSVTTRVTWDDLYLYVAMQVDDTDIGGTNSRPMSQPEQDDSVAVYVHTGADRPTTPSAATHAMLVSAAGGFSFLTGDSGTLTPKPLFSIKYGVALQGTLNRSDDRDKGYTVTLAIPLEALGIDPKTLKTGTELAFNTVVRTRSGGLTSASANVKTEADTASPAKWTRLILGASDATVSAEKETIVAAKVAATSKPPLIDGTVRELEWPAVGGFVFRSPDKPKALTAIAAPVVPGIDSDTKAPTLSTTAPLTGMNRQLFARYLLGYQGDLRKAYPTRGVFGPDGSMLLADQPAAGIGPWFSTDRVNWHRSQLTDMRRAGIDAALVEYSSPTSQTGLLDEKSVLVMLAALREMAQENQPAPRVAPCILGSSLGIVSGDKVDVSAQVGRGALYRAIRRWFTLVPPEMRVRVALPPDAEGHLVFAYPVFLSEGGAISGMGSATWADEMRSLFAEEFGTQAGGTTLLFIGGDGFGPNTAGMAALLPLRTAGKSTGQLSADVIQPGMLTAERVTARAEGAVYKESWAKIAADSPSWTVIDSWNDFTRGTEIAPSRQYGQRYVDQTRILGITTGNIVPLAARWVTSDPPRRIASGQVVQFTATVQNAGTKILSSGENGVAVAYRWKQGGKVVSEGPLRLPLPEPLLPTQTTRVNVGLAAVQVAEEKLTPLPPGEYTVELDLATGATDAPAHFLSDGDKPESGPPLRFPVTVATDLPEYVEIASATTSPILVGGGVYPVSVRIRWMGKEPLAPGTASLSYQFQSEDGQTTVLTGNLPLIQPLAPGQWQTVRGLLRVGEISNPIPPACPETKKSAEDAAGYRLRWLLTRTNSTIAVGGEYVEHVAVYPIEDEARILPPSGIPQQASARALVPMEVTVINRGVQKWSAKDYSLGYHWYYPDGVEAEWKPPLTVSLPKDLAPGESIKIPITVRMPDRDGEYILAFDMLRQPDLWLSTRPVSRSGDIGLLPFRVLGGRLAFVDLAPFFNLDAVASEVKPTDGNMDGDGGSFPAESFPPDVYGIAAYFAADAGKKDKNPPAYPSGYYRDFSPAARQVSFRYGSNEDGKKNAVVCKGQSLPTPKGHYTALNLAAAATGGADRPLPLTLVYKDGTKTQVTANVGDWNRTPGAADPVAASSRQKRTPNGDVPMICALRHVIVPVDVTRELTAIVLPTDEKIKVFAASLEN